MRGREQRRGKEKVGAHSHALMVCVCIHWGSHVEYLQAKEVAYRICNF